MSAAKELSKVAEVKHSDKINGRFCVIDNKEVMFMVMNDDDVHPSYDIGVWVNTPYFATALDGMFNHSWNEMTPLSKVKV